jgi:D-alanyl-D-alanine carboxypeptidase/D-alanyl-D-alanine-endopeptidase (penicillin-binding protein 4)
VDRSRLVAVALAAAALVLCLGAPVSARPAWKLRLDRIVSGYEMGVAVAEDGRILYAHQPRVMRAPASNQKLLLTMALFDLLGPSAQLATSVATRDVGDGVARGDLWILGSGDPTVASDQAANHPDFTPTRISLLARRVAAAGIERVEGRVVGSTGFFGRDWDAPGWQPYVPARFAPLPSALTFDGNAAGGAHIDDPERRAARSFAAELRSLGIEVGGAAVGRRPPGNLERIATIHSPPLRQLTGYMNRQSSNFFAEMLGKRLAVEVGGTPGTIAEAARTLRTWARARGVGTASFDASGLSYRDRISPLGMVRLLGVSEHEPWGRDLRAALPLPGQGTLSGRLSGVDVRAKTGTHLNGDSALSGWVRLRRGGTWAEFSILSVGMPKSVEDEIVRTVARFARSPRPAPTGAMVCTSWCVKARFDRP